MSGDFSVVIQSWDKLVPSAKLSEGERPCLDYDFVRSDIGQRHLDVERGVGNSSDRTYYLIWQIM